jgi:hypothetical protein
VKLNDECESSAGTEDVTPPGLSMSIAKPINLCVPEEATATEMIAPFAPRRSSRSSFKPRMVLLLESVTFARRVSPAGRGRGV